MPRYIEKLELMKLTAVVAKGTIAFPFIPLSLEIVGSADIDAVQRANDNQDYIYIVAQRDASVEEAEFDDLYTVGTVCKINKFLKLPDDNARLVVEGVYRASTISAVKEDGVWQAEVMCKAMSADESDVKLIALKNEILSEFEEFEKISAKMSQDISLAVRSIESPGLLCDYIAANVLAKFEDRQAILEVFEPEKRLEKLAVVMGSELKIINAEIDIRNRVRENIDNNQKEYYLREQIKVIKEELGDGEDDELYEYEEKIYALGLCEENTEKLLKEVRKLGKTPYASAEAAVIRAYLDVCLEIPWNIKTTDRIDIAAAKKILEDDHDGLQKVKDRILEFLSVKVLNPGLNNQIICLVGPPGTGKTSICESIARAMERKYVRVCLGGVRDEAEIRGHRKTYIASMPGRIINALIQAKVSNPLILLDEIDKLTTDAHGDPSSALLEVLDSEQNSHFRDHFVELPVDLSDCLFVATANSLDTVPRPLLDRMEIIELDIYNRYQKLDIAKHHLIPKNRTKHGLSASQIRFTDEAILEIADKYTHEAGVRNLNREIASLCRKAARRIAEGEAKSCNITKKNLASYLGTPKISETKINRNDEVGVVNGLAYTELGGDLLKIEASSFDGTGKLELTGSLGDVMKESAKTALSVIRKRSDKLGIEQGFYKNKDIHIHVPEGAVPKDGPSAGVSLATALASELSGRRVKRDIAMTGEITLHGNVLAIGGLPEKSMAAYRAGVKTIFIPKDNMKDIEKVDKTVTDNIEFIPVSNIDTLLSQALV